MNIKYSFCELLLNDKKLITMIIRGFFGDPREVWLGGKRVINEESAELNHASLGLPREALDQFKQLCLKKGIHLSGAEIAREAHNLINFTRVVNGMPPYLDKKS